MKIAANIHPSYLKLMGEFPLRPINSAGDYRRASEVLDRLAVRHDSDGKGADLPLDSGESDYLELLSLLIEDFDRRHYPMPRSDASPVDALRFLMQQRSMTNGDVGQIIGSKGTASEILNGKREMSKSAIVKLAEHFNVDPGLFLRPAKRDRRSA